jgi:putrescine transport system permease protein
VILGDNGLINNFLKIIGISSTNFITLNSNFSLIITMAYTYLPFMIVPIYSSLEKIDHSLFEAAADLGAKKTKIFIKIIFPLSSTGVMLGCLLVFIASFGEYVIPDLLGSNTITIGKLIWSEFFYNRDWVAAATMTIIIILIAIVPFILLNRYLLRAKNVT